MKSFGVYLESPVGQAVETSYSADDKEVQNILNKKDGAAEQRPGNEKE